MRFYKQLSTLVDTLRFQAKEHPDTVAIICDDIQVSYFALEHAAHKLANALTAHGVCEGDRIAYLGKESEHYYELLFACALIGAILVPVNCRLTGKEVSYILKDSRTQVLFFDVNFKNILDELLCENPQLEMLVTLDFQYQNLPCILQWLEFSNTYFAAPEIDTNTIVVQIYTSGTTGLPKGVQLAHKSFFEIQASLIRQSLNWIDWYENDISLIGIPGFHIGGLWWAVQGFNAGITNVITQQFVASAMLDLIESYQVTTSCIVPSTMQLLLEQDLSLYDLSQLRKLVYGGAPISETLLTQAVSAFNCEFTQIYGLTETGNVAVCLPPEAHIVKTKKMKAAGLPCPCVSIKIIDPHGNELTEGEVGEICLQSPAHMAGYWLSPETTSAILVDDWLRTGDVGYLENEYLFICDRIKDTIIVAGENVYPSEIENVLIKHTAIQEVAVVGVPDKQWGESVYAVIVTTSGMSDITLKELKLYLKGQLADYKTPQQLEFVSAIPRNPNGKILRRKLRDRYWVDMERKVN
ncbi:long-chain-fatty-acid--CoA ligase [Aliikangiella sp. IMCC44359]|uniref:long-chain-fatty-acid--CoA ligase n=1 Tax=Aliikangiella sp. IMCC44359 TaxID=3459125 RepID=UPI00403B2652